MQTLLLAHIGLFHIHPGDVAVLAVLALVSTIIWVVLEITARNE